MLPWLLQQLEQFYCILIEAANFLNRSYQMNRSFKHMFSCAYKSMNVAFGIEVHRRDDNAKFRLLIRSIIWIWHGILLFSMVYWCCSWGLSFILIFVVFFSAWMKPKPTLKRLPAFRCACLMFVSLVLYFNIAWTCLEWRFLLFPLWVNFLIGDNMF